MGCGSSTSVLAKELENNGKNEKISNTYVFKNVLGVGNFGTVREGVHKRTGQYVAVKRIPRTSKTPPEKLADELKVMRKVKHVNCIELLDLFYDDLHIYMVQELARGGELLERISKDKQFNEKNACKIFKQVLEGLSYLHSVGIAHRDIKPENILMLSNDPQAADYYSIKLADYGFASMKAQEFMDTMKTPCGTPEYIAPEIIAVGMYKDSQKSMYSAKVDVWSAGCILYTMLCGTSPFLCPEISTMLVMIKEGKYAFGGPRWANVSQLAQSFISRMLTVNPSRRPTCDECLKDKWITDSEIHADKNLDLGGELLSYVQLRRAKRATLVVQAVGRLQKAGSPWAVGDDALSNKSSEKSMGVKEEKESGEKDDGSQNDSSKWPATLQEREEAKEKRREEKEKERMSQLEAESLQNQSPTGKNTTANLLPTLTPTSKADSTGSVGKIVELSQTDDAV